MKKYEPIFGSIFLLIIILYSCCGCAKDAVINPSTACYSCIIQQWQEQQDGNASEDKTTTVDLCGQTESAIHAYEYDHTYSKKQPNQFGFLVLFHSRAICSKK